MVVYKITNTVNEKCYIGCTINFEARIKKHFSGKNSGSSLLYKAVLKYGKDVFIVEILGHYTDEKSMFEAEVIAIKQNNSAIPNGYNIHLGGNGGKIILTETQIKNRQEHARKLSISNKGNTWNKGRICPEQTRVAVSKRHLGKKLSDETS